MSGINQNETNQEYLDVLREPELRISLPNFPSMIKKAHEEYFIGREKELDQLVNLLDRNQNGSYLVSGYRGVGKTFFVKKALEKYKEKEKEKETRIIEAKINLGSDNKLTSRTVLSNVVSLLIDEIEDKLKDEANIASKLVQHSTFLFLSILVFSLVLLLSLCVPFNLPFLTKIINSEPNLDWVVGVSSTLGFILSLCCLIFRSCFSYLLTPLAALKVLQRKIYFSSENNVSVGDKSIGILSKKEFSNPLDNNQIESKLINILKEAKKDKTKKMRIIFIFDELDKLTGQATEKAEGSIDLIKESKLRKLQIDNILGDLKSLITDSEATYIFIAGRDMHDAYLSERGSANSLYESLFNDHIYIPSLLTDHSDKEVYVLDSMIEAFVVSNLVTKSQLTSKRPNKDKEEKKEDHDKKFYINDYLQYLKLSTYAEEAESDGVFLIKAIRDLSGVAPKEKEKSDFESNIQKFFYSCKELERIEKSVDSKDRLYESAVEFNQKMNVLKINYSKFEKVIKKKEEHEKITEIYILKILIHFLTLHSWGNYKRLITLFESFVIYRNGNYELFLRTKDIQRIVLSSHLYIMFHHNLSRMLINADDKLVVSSFSVFLHIMKYHGIGFSRENILRMYETINLHSSPELIRVVDIILNNVLSNYIRIIRRSGIYRYRFSYLHEREIHFITNINQDESAAFNFSLNAMDAVKQHYRNLIFDSKYTNSDEKYGHIALASIHIIVGDFYFWEQSYDEASIHYGIASDILERNYTTKLDSTVSENKNTIILQLIEVYLKQGSVAERIGNLGKAESIYNDAVKKSNEYLLRIQKEDRDQNPEWGILLQPIWAKNYLLLKHSSFNRVSANSVTTYLSKYKDAGLLLFMGKFPEAHSIFMQACCDISQLDHKSYFLLGNSYLRAAFCLFLNFSRKLHKKLGEINDKNGAQLESALGSVVKSINGAIIGIKSIADEYRIDKEKDNITYLIKLEEEILSKQRSKGKHFIEPENEEEEIRYAFGLLRLSIFYFIKGRLNLDAAISSLSIVMMWEALIEMLPWQRIQNSRNHNDLMLLECIKKNIQDIRGKPRSIILESQEQALTAIAYNTSNASSHFMKTSLHKNLHKKLPDTLFGDYDTVRDLIINDKYLEGHGLFQHYSIFGQVVVSSIYWEEMAFKRIENSRIQDLGNLRNGYILPYGIRYYTTMLWLRGRLLLDDILNTKFENCEIFNENKPEQEKLRNELISTALNALILLFRSSQYVIKAHGDASSIGMPPLHVVYYNMWEILFRLMSLYKDSKKDKFNFTIATLELRDLLDDNLKQNDSIKDISSRIFDILQIEKVALEQLKIVEQIGNSDSMNRINIMRNKYYLDDDYEDNMFNLDWTYCRFFAPGSVIYRMIIKYEMRKLRDKEDSKEENTITEEVSTLKEMRLPDELMIQESEV